MTRAELIKKMALRTSLPEPDTDAAARIILEAIAARLAQGARVEIRGFGNFTVRQRPARQSQNPKTGDRVMVPAKAWPYFKAGKELGERVDYPAPWPNTSSDTSRQLKQNQK